MNFVIGNNNRYMDQIRWPIFFRTAGHDVDDERERRRESEGVRWRTSDEALRDSDLWVS